MKKIETLISDIYDRIGKPFAAEDVEHFGSLLARKLAIRLSESSDQKQALRASNLGTPCERKLWYSVNTPEAGKSLSPSARIKFLLGDIFEEVMLFLAKASGHSVVKEQADVTIAGVPGHIDAIVDGELIDCKTTSPYSFQKFKEHRLETEDPFGYTTQLDTYLHALDDEPELKNHDRAHFLAGHKVLGHLCLDTYPRRNVNYETLVAQKKQMLAFPQPPSRSYAPIPEGASGNEKLGIECSYCPFLKTCWPGVRTFAYAKGPVHLVTVKREPKGVPEVDSDAEE